MLVPRSRLEWVAGGVNLAAAMLAVVAACVGIGSAGEISHFNEAVAARTPAASRDGGTGSLVCLVWQNTQSGSLEAIWFGDNASDAGRPPGAPWPELGTAWVSPRLSGLLAEGDPLALAMVPGTVVGVIGREALTGPDDLLAYVGVDAAKVAISPCAPANGFGVPLAESVMGTDPGVARIGTAVGLSAGGLGAMVALLASAQLLAVTRSRRLAACVLIGMRPGTLALMGAWGASIWSAAGALLGIAALWPAGALLAARPTFGVSHWATVALVPWPARLAVAAVVVLVCAVLGHAGSVREPWAVRRRIGEYVAGSRWRVLPLAIAAALLVFVAAANLHIGSSRVSAMSGTHTLLLLVGLALGAIGLVAAQPLITRSLRPLAANAPLSLRLAVARFTHESAATRWFAVGLAVGVLGLGMAAGMTSDMSGRLRGHAPASGAVVVDLPPREAWAQPSGFDEAVARISQSRSLLWMAATDLSAYASPDASAGPASLPTQRPLMGLDQLTDADELQAGMGWADASEVAAVAVAGWQSNEQFPAFIVLNQTFDQPYRLVLEVASVGLVSGIALAAFAVGAALIGLQARREDGDRALLAVGLSHKMLASVRAWEAGVAALPLGLIATVLASVAAVGLQRVDDTTLPVDWGMLVPIVATPLLVTAVAAAAAAIATPGASQAAVRRD